MELIAYIILICLSVFTLLTESKTVYKWIFIPSVIIFLFIVRNEGYDSDIINYASQMQATGLDFYYLREFVFYVDNNKTHHAKILNNKFYKCINIFFSPKYSP